MLPQRATAHLIADFECFVDSTAFQKCIHEIQVRTLFIREIRAPEDSRADAASNPLDRGNREAARDDRGIERANPSIRAGPQCVRFPFEANTGPRQIIIRCTQRAEGRARLVRTVGDARPSECELNVRSPPGKFVSEAFRGGDVIRDLLWPICRLTQFGKK
jgi:hypothetical protein